MAGKKTIVIERSYAGSLHDVWELWTTKEGIESWWGPEGFSVTVHQLELKPGGLMRYAMSAVAPETIAYMKSAGMPTTTESRITFLDVQPLARLAYSHGVDFVPGVAAYDVDTVVKFKAEGGSVKLTLTLDAMHNEEWTGRMVMGWEMELGKLAKVLQAKGARA